MNVQFKDISLGIEAKDYIVGLLKRGKHLSSCLAQIAHLFSGEIITRLPLYSSYSDATDFTHGCKIKENIKSNYPILTTDAWLAQLIVEFLLKNNNNICIFEDALALPTDKYLIADEIPFFTYENDVYLLITNRKANFDKAIKGINAASAYRVIGILTSICTTWDLPPNACSVSIEQLYGLANNAMQIIVGAYDQESYLVWNRS